MKSAFEEPLYKYSLPFRFYFAKIAVIVVAIALGFLSRHDLAILLFVIFFALLVLFSSGYYILEVYEDQFKLISPNFFSGIFSKTDTYYFDELFGFEYTKQGEIGTVQDALLYTALSFIFRPGLAGYNRNIFGRKQGTPPSIKFDHTVNAETEEVTYTFDNADDAFLKGLEILSEQMNKKAAISQNGHKHR